MDSTIRSSTERVMYADCFDGRTIRREGYPQAARIIRAQLSSDELKLLFFTGITDKGRKFGILANKYALFDNFDLSKQPYANIMRESLSESSGYEPAAFSSEEAKRKYYS